MNTYLVTGGAGFIGSHLCDALLARHDRVICVDNFSDFYDPARKRRNIAAASSSPDFEVIEADIRDDQQLEEIVAAYRPDKIAHIAAMASVAYSVRHPKIYADVNVRGTLNVLEAARQHGCKGLVIASTSSIYGRTEKIPFVETDTTDRPLAPYPASKKAAEVLAAAYFNSYGLSSTCVRFFNVYGPRGRPDMTPYMFTDAIANGRPITLYDGGRPRRDWTYVGDIVAGLVAALEVDLGYEIINLGRGQPVMMRDFVTIIEELVDQEAQIMHAPLPVSEPEVTYADVTRARVLLGYDPQVSVAEGLANLWTWYKQEMGS